MVDRSGQVRTLVKFAAQGGHEVSLNRKIFVDFSTEDFEENKRAAYLECIFFRRESGKKRTE